MATSDQYGAFVPTNLIWDIQQIESSESLDPKTKELLVRLYQNINNIALVLNIKHTGMYQLSEFVNGKLLFPNPNNSSSTTAYPANRQVLSKTLNIGALGAGVTSVNHNITITANTQFIMIIGAANDNVGHNYYGLSWASAAGATNIELKANATQVTITNNSGINFTSCIVYLEYVQS